MLLFLLSGLFLLRLVVRQLLSLLFQEPPRTTLLGVLPKREFRKKFSFASDKYWKKKRGLPNIRYVDWL